MVSQNTEKKLREKLRLKVVLGLAKFDTFYSQPERIRDFGHQFTKVTRVTPRHQERRKEINPLEARRNLAISHDENVIFAEFPYLIERTLRLLEMSSAIL